MGINKSILAKEGGRKPEWFKIKPPTEKYTGVVSTIKKHGLNTVCGESHCPNISECWSGGTATFMVMGDTCTRGCKFCNIKTARKGEVLDKEEPKKLAKALKELEMFDYVVLTSVDRDDLADEGSGHFASCIKEIKKENPDMLIEVLIPDFKGNTTFLKKIINAKPDVIAHNIETVKRLQKTVRDPRAHYEQSLSVLENVKRMDASITTKTSLMVGLGEREQEVHETMEDLRHIDVDIVTFGQYLRPSKKHLPVVEYIHPEQFEKYKEIGERLGFKFVASGPFVRSSYKAGELFVKKKQENAKGVLAHA